MKIEAPVLMQAGGFLGAAAARSWMSTLDYRVAYYDDSVDPVRDDIARPRIYIFWHEYILFPIYLRGHCRLSMLLSRHRDAEVLSHAAHYLGFDCVRGSTYRGAAAALRTLASKSRQNHLTITPDGPRGPRRSLAQGAIYLASTLGLPVVAMGFGYDRPWRLRTWDRFAIPRPFSRARAVIGPPLAIPAGLDRAGLEHYRGQVERLMQRLTLEAENWAFSGISRQDERPLRREHPASRPFADSRRERQLQSFWPASG